MKKKTVSRGLEARFHIAKLLFTLMVIGVFMPMASAEITDFSPYIEIVEHTPECFVDCYSILRIHDLPEDVKFAGNKYNFDLWGEYEGNANIMKYLRFSKLTTVDREVSTPIYDNCVDVVDVDAGNTVIGQECDIVGYDNTIVQEDVWKNWNPNGHTWGAGEEIFIRIEGKKTPKEGSNNVDWRIDINGWRPDWAWWNSSWDKRIPINITSDSLYADRDNDLIDMNITNMSLFTNDCSRELRFTDELDNELAFSILDDSGQAIGDGDEWCVVRLITGENITASSSRLYYVYYDNTNPPFPDYHGIEIYGNNFTAYDLSDWSPNNLRMDVNRTGGVMEFIRNSGGGGGFATDEYVGNSTPICDFTLTVDLYSNNADGDTARLGLIDYNSGAVWDSTIQGNEYAIDPRDDTDDFREDTVWTNQTSIVRNAYQWYKLKLQKNGANYNGYADGTFSLYEYNDNYTCAKPGWVAYVGGVWDAGDSALVDNYCMVGSPDYECQVYNTTLTYDQYPFEQYSPTTTSTTTTPTLPIDKIESKLCDGDHLVTNVTEWNGTAYNSAYNSTICEYGCAESWLGTKCKLPSYMNGAIWIAIFVVLIWVILVIYGFMRRLI